MRLNLAIAIFTATTAGTTLALEDTNPLKAENFTQVFEAKDHPKARRVNIIVKYPKGWKALEASSPLIVQKFNSTTPLDHPELQIQVSHVTIGLDIEESCRKSTIDEIRKGMETTGIKAVDIKKLEAKGRPAIQSTSTATVKSGTLSVPAAIRNLNICYRDKLIILGCFISDLGGTEESALQRLNVFDKLCNNFFEFADIQ